MSDKETTDTIQDYAIETRVVLDMLIKLMESDDTIPAYYLQAINLVDEKYKKRENILRKL